MQVLQAVAIQALKEAQPISYRLVAAAVAAVLRERQTVDQVALVVARAVSLVRQLRVEPVAQVQRQQAVRVVLRVPVVPQVQQVLQTLVVMVVVVVRHVIPP